MAFDGDDCEMEKVPGSFISMIGSYIHISFASSALPMWTQGGPSVAKYDR
jgi:hypothetical protein